MSAIVASTAVLCSIVPGIMIGWLLSKKSGFFISILNIFVYLPLVMPPVVVGYLLLLLFSNNGPLGNLLLEFFNVSINFSWIGAALASALVSFPLLVRAIKQGFDELDPRIIDAAKIHGANQVSCFFTITFPLMLPAILTGITLAFARSLAEFGATITFVSNIPGETRTLPLALFAASSVPGSDYIAFRLLIISLLLALLAIVISELLSRRTLKRSKGIS